MFHIAIVDDDQSIHQKLEEMITSILFKYPIHFAVSHFFSGNEFSTHFNTLYLIRNLLYSLFLFLHNYHLQNHPPSQHT